MRRARPSHGHEDRGGNCLGEEELEPAHLVAAAARGRAILPLDRECRDAQRPRELGRRLERRRPHAETTRGERGAYLLGQPSRFHHCEPRSQGRPCGLPPTISATPRPPPASPPPIPSAPRPTP